MSEFTQYMVTEIHNGEITETICNSWDQAVNTFIMAVAVQQFGVHTVSVTLHGWADKIMAYDSAKRIQFK